PSVVRVSAALVATIVGAGCAASTPASLPDRPAHLFQSAEIKDDESWPARITLCSSVRCPYFNSGTVRPGETLEISTVAEPSSLKGVPYVPGYVTASRDGRMVWCSDFPFFTLHHGQALLLSSLLIDSECGSRGVAWQPIAGVSARKGPPAEELTPQSVATVER